MLRGSIRWTCSERKVEGCLLVSQRATLGGVARVPKRKKAPRNREAKAHRSSALSLSQSKNLPHHPACARAGVARPLCSASHSWARTGDEGCARPARQQQGTASRSEWQL